MIRSVNSWVFATEGQQWNDPVIIVLLSIKNHLINSLSLPGSRKSQSSKNINKRNNLGNKTREFIANPMK